MLIAAQLYTVRDHLRDPHRLGEVLRHLRRIGYGAVEVAGLGPGLEVELTKQLEATGLTACAAHVSLDQLATDPDAIASRCNEWGCEYAVIPSVSSEFHSAAGYRRLAALATELAAALRPHGIGLAYHNHAFELETMDGTNGLEVLYQSASPDDLKAELDTYWLRYAGVDPAKWIRRLAGRVPLVHLKDMSMTGETIVQTEIGQGELDWPDILGACRDAHTDWLIVEQDDCAGDPLESLDISYRNLARLLSGQDGGGPKI